MFKYKHCQPDVTITYGCRLAFAMPLDGLLVNDVRLCSGWILVNEGLSLQHREAMVRAKPDNSNDHSDVNQSAQWLVDHPSALQTQTTNRSPRPIIAEVLLITPSYVTDREQHGHFSETAITELSSRSTSNAVVATVHTWASALKVQTSLTGLDENDHNRQITAPSIGFLADNLMAPQKPNYSLQPDIHCNNIASVEIACYGNCPKILCR
ncbi:hypothetical protein CSKR_107987 [Clonorchis sinensis]|uniref:Uncharacterized protein n=1 Tax=Clonorchis sinensis TaxID=79923 RepID=A0A3R7FP80_CLOSI|nr:hypothetical protein CSKR_107987 [Clonorchis sinensis]